MNLSDITNSYGRLKSVYSIKAHFDDESAMVVAVKLVFERGEVYHEALPEYDEISCSHELSGSWNKLGLKCIDVGQEAPWVSVLNLEVIWVWTMTNQQGYDDAIQYSFASPIPGNNQLIQLVTMASEIKAYGIEVKL